MSEEIIKARKLFKKHPLGGTFYPDWMGEIINNSKAFIRKKKHNI